MVLLVLVLGLLVAAWPAPILRVAGTRSAASPTAVRLVGAAVALAALLTALLLGP